MSFSNIKVPFVLLNFSVSFWLTTTQVTEGTKLELENKLGKVVVWVNI